MYEIEETQIKDECGVNHIEAYMVDHFQIIATNKATLLNMNVERNNMNKREKIDDSFQRKKMFLRI